MNIKNQHGTLLTEVSVWVLLGVCGIVGLSKIYHTPYRHYLSAIRLHNTPYP